MPTLFAATSNPGKLREFRAATLNSGVTVEALPGLDALPTPAEDARTFAGNADRKAVAYSLHAPGALVLADDSGLEVDALGGRPGVLSARFADIMGFETASGQSRPERNNRCLLAMLAELERSTGGRATGGARFVCALAVARNGQVLLRAEGTVEGDITDIPRGPNGFGYDPLFVVRSLGRTLAELNPEEKWAISHRGNAFRNLLPQLASQLPSVLSQPLTPE